MDQDATRARFPEVRVEAGHYESFYVKAHHPGERLGFWIRYTVLKRPGASATGSLWFTLFDATAGAPRASKVTRAQGIGAGDGAWIRVGDALVEPGRLVGSALEASWDLRFESSEEPLYHLPRSLMYRAPIPRTKPISPHPVAEFKGTLRVGERTIEVAGWPGMLGHNWGAEHAERWIWMHAVGFEGRGRDTWLDATIGRIKLGPVTTPWIANGVLCLDGSRFRIGGPERARSTKVLDRYHACEFTLPGKDISVVGSVSSDPAMVVGWVYDDPGGPQHHVFNGSIADMEIVVRRGGGEERLAVRGGAAYELGVREQDHGLPLQPYGEEPS